MNNGYVNDMKTIYTIVIHEEAESAEELAAALVRIGDQLRSGQTFGLVPKWTLLRTPSFAKDED